MTADCIIEQGTIIILGYGQKLIRLQLRYVMKKLGP